MSPEELPLPDENELRPYSVVHDSGGSLLVEAISFGAEASMAWMAADECRIWERIAHPNVRRMVGTREGESAVFLYYEHQPAWQLSELLLFSRHRGVPMPLPVAAAIFSEVLMGLQEIHMAGGPAGEFLGMVHRLADPRYILVGQDGVTRLLPPGLGRLQDAPGCRGPGALVRQPLRYLAPEQVKGKVIDSRADLYAVGAGLWEALTSQIFLRSDTDLEVIQRIAEGKVERPGTARPDLPVALDAVVMKALSLSPDDRYPQAASMLKALISAVPPASPREVALWALELGCREFPYNLEGDGYSGMAGRGDEPGGEYDEPGGQGGPYRSGPRRPRDPGDEGLAEAPPGRGWMVIAALVALVLLAMATKVFSGV